MNLLRRLGISKYMINNWHKISYFSTRKLQKKVKTGNPNNIVVYKGAAVSVDPTASIELGTGRVIVNASWFDVNPFPSLLSLRARSRMVIHGPFSIYSDANISVNEDAILEIGSGFVNHGARIHCFQSIKIGTEVFIGDDVAIRDCDGHEIVGSDKPMTMPIVIEDHVWIGAKVTILKGVTIGEGSVVAAGSVVSHDVPPHVLVAGVPARVVKENVSWQ